MPTDPLELITELEKAAEEHRLGKDVGPTRQQYLVRYAAKALRAQIAETDRLRTLLDKRRAQQHEVDRLEGVLADARRLAENALVIDGPTLAPSSLATLVDLLTRTTPRELAEARAATPEPSATDVWVVGRSQQVHGHEPEQVDAIDDYDTGWCVWDYGEDDPPIAEGVNKWTAELIAEAMNLRGHDCARRAIDTGQLEQVGWRFERWQGGRHGFLPYSSGEAGHAEHERVYRLVTESETTDD